jgi:predicted nicotinamide N-methyase
MPGYTVETTRFRIGADDYDIRALSDRRQFSDPEGTAERAGISSAAWPLFGVVWPAGLALAKEMSTFPVAGKHILEVGCGLGLCSLVLQRRGADITACDRHPLAEGFLRHNTDLNGLPPIPYRNAPWSGPNPALGRFDLILGSDLLYERDQPALLCAFIAHHANPVVQVLLADPGRGNCGPFSALMAAAGYTLTERWLHFALSDTASSQGRFLSFTRGHA